MPNVTFYPQDHGLTERTASGEAWGTIRAGAGTGVSKSGIVSLTATPNATSGWNKMSRYHFVFDTSSIPDTAVISSASISIWFSSYNLEASGGVIIHSASVGGTVSSGDYPTYGAATSSRKTSLFTGTGAGDANVFSIGTGTVSLTGVSGFALLTYSDSTNSEPNLGQGGAFLLPYGNFDLYSGSYGTVGIRPQLTVSYTVPAVEVTPGGAQVDWNATASAVNTVESVSPGGAHIAWEGSAPVLEGLEQPAVEINWNGAIPDVFLSGVLEVAPGAVEINWNPSASNAFVLPIYYPPLYVVPDKWYINSGSTGIWDVIIKLRQSNDEPIDLTQAASVQYYVWREDSGAYDVNGNTCTIIDAENGIVSARILVGAKTAGTYLVDFEINLYDGTKEVVPSSGFARIYVRDTYV